jgi:hypothetical protein
MYGIGNFALCFCVAFNRGRAYTKVRYSSMISRDSKPVERKVTVGVTAL